MKYERSGRCQTVTIDMFWICYFCHAIKAAASQSSLILMSSRNVYRGTGITPEYTDFPTLHHSISSGSSSRCHPENHEQSISEGSVPSRMHSWLASAKAVWQMNTGLLLVLASQAFFSLMNVAVKLLNSIDPPVTVLEVCLSVFIPSFIDLMTYSS